MTYVENDTKTIAGIKFGLLSPEEIRKMSVVEITESETYDEEGMPIRGGLMDRRLGTVEPGVRCETCSNYVNLCPGHFGHIELARPVIHPEFAKNIHNILKATCRSCGRLLLPKEEIEKEIEKMKRLEKQWIMLKYWEGEAVAKKAGQVKTCPHCGAPQYKIIFQKPYYFFEERDGVRVRLMPTDIRERLERIPDKDLEALGLDPKNSRPEWTILTVLPVPPISVRPTITLESGLRSEDDLTHKLVDIVRANNRLRENMESGAPNMIIDDLWDLLQFHVATFFDNELPGIPTAKHRSGRPLRTLAQRLKGKEGRFRGSLAGKRVDFSARTVISPDPNLSVNEVGVPFDIAKILLVPERVTEWNIEELRELVKRGPDNYPGANYIVRPDGGRTDLRFVRDREALAETLEPGYIVERHLRDGDIVLFNRQPSLHRMSIMAHKVKVLPYKTFRLNLLVTPPYNADFDGDEMNLHVPQTEEAKAEAELLMLVQEHIITPRYGAPIIGAIHDYITGAFMLTRKDTLLDKKLLSQLAYIGKYAGELPEPAVLKPKKYWTGKQLLSMFIPKGFDYVGSAKACFNDERCGQLYCPYDCKVIIKDGELLAGVFDKKSIAAEEPETFLHEYVRVRGKAEAAKLMDTLFKIFIAYLDITGFTLGFDDIDVPEHALKEVEKALQEARKEVDNLIKQYEEGRLVQAAGMTLEQTLENEILKVLESRVSAKASEVLEKYGKKSGSGFIMAFTGARANPINIIQMSIALGQQTVRGQRIKRGYLRRPLPHFKPGDLGPEAKGYIKSNFRRGLSPTEFFYHSMAGREGLVDTAVRTADSGYMYRRLSNALHDYYVAYDGSVRSSEGFIIQFKYGEDGVDPSRSDHGRSVNVDRIIKITVSTRTKPVEKPIEEEKLRAIVEGKASYLPKKVRDELIEKIISSKLSEEEAEEVIKKALKEYREALVDPGEAVGMVAAESLGEPSTQMTLRTFHFAGLREFNITLGLPRLKEIVDLRREPKTPIMYVYLTGDYAKDKNKALELARKMELTTIRDVSENIEVDYITTDITITLDPEMLEDRGITVKDVAKALSKIKGKKGKIEKIEGEKPVIIYHTDIDDVIKLRRMYERIGNIKLKGLKGINHALIREIEENGEKRYMIVTEGSNLAAVLSMEGVDTTRTVTNNIIETANVLGIEAARNLIIREMKSVLDEFGLDVDIRHLMLVADAMSFTGKLREIGRHGVAGEKTAPLARAAFEVTVKHLADAAMRGEVDMLKGVTESIVVGSVPMPAGTGAVKLLMAYGKKEQKT